MSGSSVAPGCVLRGRVDGVFGADQVPAVEADVPGLRVVGHRIVAGLGPSIPGVGRGAVVDIAVGHRRVGGLGAVIPHRQMLDTCLRAASIDEVERLVGFLSLEEHDADPSLHRPVLRVPHDPARVGHRGVEAVVGLVDERCGLVQLVGCCQRLGRAAAVLAELVGDVMLPEQMGVRELVQHLPHRAHPAQQLADHGVGVGRVLEGAAGVGESAQRFMGFAGIAGGIGERGHRGPPSLVCEEGAIERPRCVASWWKVRDYGETITARI